MKITQKSISSFNSGKLPKFNENWNKANGIHSLREHALFNLVQWNDSGMLKEPISLKKIKEYLELYPNALDKIKKIKEY